MARHNFAMASLLWALLLTSVGCSNAGSQSNGTVPQRPNAPDARFAAYWNQGKGEITRYALEQARYGEIRSGDAVLIFVTEDFRGDKQVKLESDPAGKDVIPVLKLNLTKKFTTGIYPYSMMTSVFTPVALAPDTRAIKITTSSQEWCGHTWTQFNLRGGKYDVQEHSYFENEADLAFPMDAAMPEDEVWARIRIAPGTLPIGDISVIPGTMTARLRHIQPAVEPATAVMTVLPADSTGAKLARYSLTYANSGRSLAIDFETEFPHRIMGWSETYKDGFGPKAVMLTTRAVRTNSLMIDYWTKNSTADDSLRMELGLR
ncbi:MAG: hypothetical protein JWQ98_3265 [Chlorobi bacterium]|nr:hypothetical protein [Chlorobiota bacterium]